MKKEEGKLLNIPTWPPVRTVRPCRISLLLFSSCVEGLTTQTLIQFKNITQLDIYDTNILCSKLKIELYTIFYVLFCQ